MNGSSPFREPTSTRLPTAFLIAFLAAVLCVVASTSVLAQIVTGPPEGRS